MTKSKRQATQTKNETHEQWHRRVAKAALKALRKATLEEQPAPTAKDLDNQTGTREHWPLSVVKLAVEIQAFERRERSRKMALAFMKSLNKATSQDEPPLTP